MNLDAIVIANNAVDSFSVSNPLRLRLDGHTATLQVVRNFLANGGRVAPPIEGEGCSSWETAPKLNGIYLYSALTNAGFSAALIDDYHRERERFATLAGRSPLAVVISTTFIVDRDSLLALVRDVKQLCPTTTVIVGGPFVAFSWRIWQRAGEPPYNQDAFFKDILFFDADGDATDLYVISDTGEALLMEAIVRLRTQRTLDGLPNTARPEGKGYRFGERIDDVASWREAPINWSILPNEVFSSGVVPLRASTGCPYDCSFCNFNKDIHLTRVKPLDDLVAEMKAVEARGVRYVWFADDNFRLGKRDLAEVCERFINEKITLKWMTLLRAEVLKDIDPELLRRAGCVEVQMGIESADESVLAAMNKKADPALNEAVITRLLRSGVNCSCYFVFGFPGETEVSVSKTIAFLRRLETVGGEGLFSWSLYPFVLIPGSPVFEADQRSRFGLVGYKHIWKHCTMDSELARQCVLKAFMALDQSGPIYRGDNLDQLCALPPAQARSFLATRHALEKLSIAKQLDNSKAFVAFSGVLGH